MIPILGSTPLTAVLGSGVNNRDHNAVRAFIRSACDIGLALLLIWPDSKLPADMRSIQKRNRDDKLAREEAKAAGRRDWQTVKSPSGLALASSDKDVVLRYLDAYIKKLGDDVAVNLAVELGKSRLLVVDCDTGAQMRRFREAAEISDDVPPTVVTPGVLRDGDWLHREGGHFYFTVPEDVELPENLGAVTWGGDDGFAVLWRHRYVLIPPSTRPEGAYQLVGRDYPVPTWMVRLLNEKAEVRASRVSDIESTANPEIASAVDEWADSVSWSAILEPLGWTPTPRADSCGCEVWTAPGYHASPKSATAHDTGCAAGRYTETNAPLHIWTDHDVPPFDEWVKTKGTQTITKLQAVAMISYGGSVGRAMDKMGMMPELAVEPGLEKGSGTEDTTDIGTGDFSLPEPVEGPEPDDDSPYAESVDRPDPDVFDSPHNGVPRIAPFSHWREMPPPEFIIEDLIEHGGLSSIIGAPGRGKSTVALDMACHIATGKRWQGRSVLKTKVLYLPGEGLAGSVQRVKAWEDVHGIDLSNDLLMGNGIILVQASNEAWADLGAYIARQGIALVIFDTFARMSIGLEENSATEVGKAVRRFDKLRELTNAGVCVVHHTSKATPDIARGSNALNGALDSELLVRDATWDTDQIRDADGRLPGRAKAIEVYATKQKNIEQTEEGIPLLMRNHEPVGAPIITAPNGEIDPMQGDVVLARPIAEPIVETAIRIAAFAARFPQQGITRTEAAIGVRPDPYTTTRTDAGRHWKQKVSEAIDRALRYALLETLTGTPAGSRYIVSTGTPESARAAAAAEVMGGDD